MPWNGQSLDWPNFKWDHAWITTAEKQFLVCAGIAIRALKHLGSDEREPEGAGAFMPLK